MACITCGGGTKIRKLKSGSISQSLKSRKCYNIMFDPNKNPPGYKEHVISFIAFAFGEVITIIYWLVNMRLYV